MLSDVGSPAPDETLGAMLNSNPSDPITKFKPLWLAGLNMLLFFIAKCASLFDEYLI